MSEFTAEKAREIVATESFSSRGYVIDQIKKAARNDQTSVGIKGLKLSEVDKTFFVKGGFTIVGNTISWAKKEN